MPTIDRDNKEIVIVKIDWHPAKEPELNKAKIPSNLKN